VMRPQPTHCFRVLRLVPRRLDTLPLSAAAKMHLRQARAQPTRSRLWPLGSGARTGKNPFEIGDDQMGAWFGGVDVRGPSVSF